MKWKITITTEGPDGTITREVTAKSDAEVERIRAKLHASTPKGHTRDVEVTPK